MSDDDDDEEIKELKALEKKKEFYGWDNEDKDYKKRLKLIMNKYMKQESTKSNNTSAPTARAKFEWVDIPIPGLVDKKAKTFEDSRKLMKDDLKSDPDCRGGELNNFKGSSEKVKFVRRIAVVKGVHYRYRIVGTKDGKYTFQSGGPVDPVEEDSQDDGEAEDDAEEVVEKPPPPPPKAPKAKTGKNSNESGAAASSSSTTTGSSAQEAVPESVGGKRNRKEPKRF